MKKFLLLLSFIIPFFHGIAKADDGGFTLQFCRDLGSWYSLLPQNKVDYKCYLYITPEVATKMAGNKITEITFSAASSFETSPRSGSVFVTEDIAGAPATSTECTIDNCYAKYLRNQPPYQTVALDEPYTVKENTGFYFGYTVNSCRYSAATGNTDSPVGVDGRTPNGFSGFVELKDTKSGEIISTIDLAKDMGDSNTNLFLAATTVGEVQGLFNILTLGNLSIGENFTLPVYCGDTFESLSLPIKNNGLNEITSIEYSFDINGEPGTPQTLETSIAPGRETKVKFDAPEYVLGRNNVSFHVSKVNDAPLDIASSASCFVLDGEEDGYHRKFVVEEGTGTACGYCPRGIVGMEKMSEKYPDDFIGIAVHGNIPSPDKLTTTSYQPLVNTFFGGAFPNCVVNRDPIFVLDPNFEYLDLCKEFWSAQRSPAEVELAVEPLMNGLKVTANTTFAYDEEDAYYKLAFVLLEDGLKETQLNYFCDAPKGTLEWWEDQPEHVEWTYSDTARDIYDCFGLPNSVPNSIEGGKTMSYTASLAVNNVTDMAKTSVVALLLDGKTNVILNAVKVKATGYPGDVNNDGKVDVNDVVRLVAAIHDNSTPINKMAADVNEDGEIDGNDVGKLVNQILE